MFFDNCIGLGIFIEFVFNKFVCKFGSFVVIGILLDIVLELLGFIFFLVFKEVLFFDGILSILVCEDFRVVDFIFFVEFIVKLFFGVILRILFCGVF